MNYFNLEDKRVCKSIFFRALMVRIIVLIVILTLSDKIEPYILTDDTNMVVFAKAYLQYAIQVFDVEAFSSALLKIGGNNSYQIWFWIGAMLTYLFRSTVAIRIFNIIISALSTVIIYKLCLTVGYREPTARTSAKLFAYMPYMVFMACFPLKDIMFTALVLYFMLVLCRIRKDNNWTINRILILIILVVIIRNIRGVVCEIIVALFLITYIPNAYRQKKYLQLIILILVTIIIIALFGQNLFDAFAQKVSDYGTYNRAAGFVSLFRIDSITQIYKLPFSYVWSMAQPILDKSSDISLWLKVVSALNFTALPILISNVMYLISFRKKKNWFYWSTFCLHLASIVLSLGTFRHYLYITPFLYINTAVEKQIASKQEILIIIAGTQILSILIIMYSFI